MKKSLCIILALALICSVTLVACNNHTHSYVSQLTKYPTCNEDGVRTYTCDCGDTYTEVISMNSELHDYSFVEKEEAGYLITTYTCQHCQHTYDKKVPINGDETPHTCQSVCVTCGKCTNATCAETICAEKCEGHQQTTHNCSSVCPICQKCTNTACAETACAEKCAGHNQQGGDTPVKVYLVGDSTVCNYGSQSDLAYPRNGYGMWLGEYLNSNATVVNLALSGRSSKSFLAEANYTTLTTSISAGDYLIIGFGHNDEKSDDTSRYTNPTGDDTDQASFQYHLYTYYIKMALDKGAYPILCTPIVRRNTSNNYSGSSGHVTNGGDYAQSIVNLGAKYNVPVINLRDLTKQLYLSLSATETAKLHATTNSVETNIDNTHLSSYGAAYVAYMLCSQLLNTNSGLAGYVDQSKLVVPDYDKVIIKNTFDQPSEGDVQVYGSWELTSYATHAEAKHTGLNLVYHSAGPMEGKVSGGVGYVKATDSAGNGSVKDGVVTTDKGYLEFVPTCDGTIVIPIKNATTKYLTINSINNETDRVVEMGTFLAGAEAQSGEGYTVTTGDTSFDLTLTVKYGYTYRIAIHGSKMCVYDCTWQPSSTSGGGSTETPEQPDEPIVDQTPTNTVVVMLEGDYTNADLSKLQLKAYNSDFYSLNYKLDQTLTIKSYTAELVDGKTKVTFTVAEQVYGIYVADHYATTSYDSAKQQQILTYATNAVTWQLDNGGWDKDYSLHVTRAWNGTESKITKGWSVNGAPLGTIDNDATYSEMRLIAEAYLLSTDATQKQTFLDSFNKAFAFLQDLQYPTGGFAQVYPRRNNYSDNVTFNDNAMVSVLKLLQDITKQRYPFSQGGIADSATQQLAKTMMDKGTEYILESQIVANGVKTAWCAQHHPTTYAPVKARAYEHPSISGSESVEIIKFLLTLTDNAKAQSSAKSAIAYLDSVKLSNMTYDSSVEPYIFAKEGETIWYRFYEIGTNKGIFSDMSGVVYYDISQITEERRTGYNWCVDTPKKLLRVYSQVGYYANKVVVEVSSAVTGNGCLLASGTVLDIVVPTAENN